MHGTRASFVAAILFAVVGAVLPGRIAAEYPYTINVILPLTGGGAFLGKQDAATLAVIEAVANKTGGIRGRPIAFHIVDDQSNPQVAVQLADQIKAGGAPVFLGPQLAAMCSAIIPLLKDGPVMYCYSPSIYPEAGSNAFSGSIASRDMIGTSVKYLRQRGVRKVALINPTDATGQDGDRSSEAALEAPENHELAIVAREHFNLSDLSVTAQMTRIKATGAQAVISWVTGSQLSTLLRGAADAGLDVPIISSTGNLLYGQLDGLSSVIGDNVYFAATPGDAIDALPPGALRRRVGDYQAAIQAAGIKADQGPTLAWDPTWIVIEALRKFGTNATPAQIRAYIAGLQNYVGVNGIYDFRANPQRGLDGSNLVMVRWAKDRHTWEIVSKPGGALLK